MAKPSMAGVGVCSNQREFADVFSEQGVDAARATNSRSFGTGLVRNLKYAATGRALGAGCGSGWLHRRSDLTAQHSRRSSHTNVCLLAYVFCHAVIPRTGRFGYVWPYWGVPNYIVQFSVDAETWAAAGDDVIDVFGGATMPVILIVDEQRLFCNGLCLLIEANVPKSQVLKVRDLASAKQHFHGNELDLVLIDAHAVAQHSLESLRETYKAGPRTAVAILSTSSVRNDVFNYLSAGFHGYVHKTQPDADLLACVSDLLSGRICVPKWIADDGEHRASLPDLQRSRLNRLTRRQKEVLALLALGMSNKEIARELRISEGTTKNHAAALLRALCARNRTEAAFKAANLQEGLGNASPLSTQSRIQQWLPECESRSELPRFGTGHRGTK